MNKKTAYLGLFLALALICNYIESLIPFYFGIPGVKLGLTNIVVVMMLYCIGAKEALLVSLLRIVLAGFMFGNMFSILYSLAGGILSFLIMYLLKRYTGLHVISISAAGGISHNIGQLFVAALVVENYNILYYASVLIIAGIITGIVIGIVAGYICAVILQSIIKRLKKVENFAAEKSEILLSRGTVSNAIPKGGVGAVSILLSTGSNVTYPAKAEDGEPIKQDKEVNILRFDGDYIIVESTSRLEDKYSGR